MHRDDECVLLNSDIFTIFDAILIATGLVEMCGNVYFGRKLAFEWFYKEARTVCGELPGVGFCPKSRDYSKFLAIALNLGKLRRILRNYRNYRQFTGNFRN